MNNKIILFLFIFLILINSFPVNAFDLTSTELEKSVCPSSTTLFNANVFGSGTFNVNVDGDAAKWTVFVPQGFGLNNQNKLVYVYVTPKFDTSPGFYSLNLIVTNTENNEVKKLNFKESIKTLQGLPEEQKKIILWAIVVVFGIIFIVFWIRFAKQSLNNIDLKQSIESIIPSNSFGNNLDQPNLGNEINNSINQNNNLKQDNIPK